MNSESITHDELNDAGSQLEDAARDLGMSKTLAVHAALYFYAAAVVTNGITDDDALRVLREMLAMIRENTEKKVGLLS